MKSGLLKQFLVISLLFSSGVVIGALSNPSLIDISQQDREKPQMQHKKKHLVKKDYFATLLDRLGISPLL